MTVYHKFKANPTKVDNIKFSSKLEAKYYEQLKLRQKSGEVLFFLRQVPMAIPGNKKYVVDFLEFHSNGEVVFTEVKGMRIPLGELKISLVEDLYPIKINVVSKV